MKSRTLSTDSGNDGTPLVWIRAMGPDQLVLLAVAWVAILAFLVHEVCSLDVWWQVNIGRDILANLDIPSVDRYAAAALGRPYHDSHWLFQVILALAHAPLGMMGVQLTMVSLWVAILAVCYRACRYWSTPPVSIVLMFLAAMASVERFLPRPELLTFFGIIVFYDLLQRRAFRSVAGLAVLALVQAAWANGHGLFVIGPFMVGCYWLWELLGRTRGDGADLAATSLAFGVVLLSTLLTPFGLGGWRYASRLLTEVAGDAPKVLATLGELSPTFGAATASGPAFWFFAATLVVCLASLVVAVRRRRFSARWLIAAGMLVAALTGRRNIVLFALVSAPLASEYLGGLVSSARGARRPLIAAVAVLMAAWSVYPLSGAYYLKMEIPARAGVGVTPSFFPHDLPGFLDSIDFDGQVLNSNTLGGFYAYHGYPGRLPLTDGRWEVYDPGRLRFILGSTRGSGDPRSVFADYGIEGILLAHSSPEAAALAPWLNRSPDWRLVYLDAAASFWLSSDLGPVGDEIDLNDLSSLPELGRPDDGLILNAFLGAVGADELRIELLRRTARFGKRLDSILPQLGALELAAGRHQDAQETYETLLRLVPTSTEAMNELAYLAFRNGDLATAKAWMDRALELDPGNVDYRENLRRIEEAIRHR